MRTHYSSQLTNIGEKVTVSGFIDTKRDHGGLLFALIRDRDGVIQCVFEENTDLPSRESVISVTGQLIKRSADTVNPNLPTGTVEIKAETFVVHSTAKPLSFDNKQPLSEEYKLKYRYMYLRRDYMQDRLAKRARLIRIIRSKMESYGFMEVQTPILTASSPEGARDFVVPSYEQKGKFYALPQAPQQFKQILMASGVDRYYQIAPCFRAEASRADRSPGEFYQLDFEIAFATQELVFEILTDVMTSVFHEFGWKTSFDSMTYDQAMEEFCCDKPDLRNPLRYKTITNDLRNNPPAVLESQVNKGDFCAKILKVPGAEQFSRKIFDDLQKYAQDFGLGGLAYAKFDGNVWTGPGSKMIPSQYLDMSQPGCVFLLAGPEHQVQVLGAHLSKHLYFDLMQHKSVQVARFCWITDYPMFEIDQTTKQIVFSHNPFSMPNDGPQALFEQDPLKIKARQYDLVCNGIELCSGAIRNHDPNALVKAFEIAGYDTQQVRSDFGAMISAFECGVPPHGGAAPGIDRILMMLTEQENIREVIAFPLSQNGQDLLMGAPKELSTADMKALGLQVTK